jgi:hypothetical protein
MKLLVLAAAAAALSLPTLAAGQVKSIGNARVSPIANTVVSRDKSGKVCKIVLRTGSRLGENKVCKTEAEWDLITQDARRATERKQIMPWKEQPG